VAASTISLRRDCQFIGRAIAGVAYFARRYINCVGGPPIEGSGFRIFSSSAVMDSTNCFRSIPFQFGYELPSTRRV